MKRRTLIHTVLAVTLGIATGITASAAFASNGVGGLVKNPISFLLVRDTGAVEVQLLS
jgi:hypothetical protein